MSCDSIRPRTKGIGREQHGYRHRPVCPKVSCIWRIETKARYFMLRVGRPVTDLFDVDLLNERSVVADIDSGT